jgi:hypothetical protein
LESARKIKESAYYTEKKAAIAERSRAAANADLSAVQPVLTAAGF